MATLTEAAYHTRKAIKYGVIVVAVLIVLRISYAIVVSVWKTTHPPPPPPATSRRPRAPAHSATPEPEFGPDARAS